MSVAVLFILLGAWIWLALGILLVTNTHPWVPDGVVARVIGILAVSSAGILCVGALLLRKRNRFAYRLVLGLLLLSALSIFLDEFGAVDLVVLLITVVPVGLLWRERRWFTNPRAAGTTSESTAGAWRLR